MNKIKLGYEIGSGAEINVDPSHLIVTGLTQKAGKTTTLESLILRSGKRAIVFRTKIGEKSFLNGTVIPPFFRDRSDWQFIQGLVESTIKEKLRSFDRAKIIQLSKLSGNSLIEFKKKVDERLLNEKINSFERDILTNLQAYLEIVLPKLSSIKFSNELQLVSGLNIVDLERFGRDSEVQSLIIRSVLEEVLYKFKNVIIVLPEAWKFIPQDRGNPCKLMVEEFIRQGSTNGNHIWNELNEFSQDFFNKLAVIEENILELKSAFIELSNNKSEIDEETIIRKVLQKTNMPQTVSQVFDKETFIAEIIKLIPQSGKVVYEVSPIEKIKKDFLEEAKNKILSDVINLSDKAKKILKFVESQNKGCNQTFIIEKLFFLSATSGGTRSWVSKECSSLTSLQLSRKDKNAVMYPSLKERIKDLTGNHGATDQEIENVYNHILYELLEKN